MATNSVARQSSQRNSKSVLLATDQSPLTGFHSFNSAPLSRFEALQVSGPFRLINFLF